MRNLKITPLEIYCDGSCRKRGHFSVGSYAYCIVRDGEILTRGFESFPETTNQKMELTAAIEGIKAGLKLREADEDIIIYSDSAYLTNCFLQKWYEKWEINGWVNSKKESVANQDLWEKLIPYFRNKFFDFRKVKGHADNHFNNLCDKMAQDSSKQLLDEWTGLRK